jgi:hypothetical protein
MSEVGLLSRLFGVRVSGGGDGMDDGFSLVLLITVLASAVIPTAIWFLVKDTPFGAKLAFRRKYFSLMKL